MTNSQMADIWSDRASLMEKIASSPEEMQMARDDRAEAVRFSEDCASSPGWASQEAA